MERCQTILPPAPPPLTTFRASLGALWFRASSAFRVALRRSSRPPRRVSLAVATNEPVTPVLTAAACNGGTLPMIDGAITPEDDKWLRPTQVLSRGHERGSSPELHHSAPGSPQSSDAAS
jgi:hypothetical protein